jgi:6-phosphogluconolactonase (cycloisomerase 2 family)
MQSCLWVKRTVTLTGIVGALFMPALALSSDHVPATHTYIYIAEQGPDSDLGSVAQFQLESDGSLIALSPATVAAFTEGLPGSVIVDPSDNALLTVDVPTTEIMQFPIGDDGLLGNSVVQVYNSNGFNSITFTPNQRFAVVTNAATVSSYAVSSTGVWTLKSVEPTGRSALSAVVDPSGRFVYVANEALRVISGYTISATGILAPLAPKNTFPAHSLPFTLVISPNGFLYSPESGTGRIAEFSINTSTGALVRAGSFPTGSGFGSGPRWIAFDTTGQYAYVANANENTVSQFKVNPTTGALTRVGSDVSTGLGPTQVVTDPSGWFVFSVNSDGTISEFAISDAGTLVSKGSISLGTGGFSYAIAFARR